MTEEEDEYVRRIEKIMEAEFYGGVPLPDEPPHKEKGEKNASRKNFHVHDFDPPRDKQMAVFTHAKKLSEYIFVITEKSPVKLRWSIVSRLLNTSVDIIEHLYRANFERESEARIEWQKRAMVSLELLDFYAETAKTKQAINFRQMTLIAEQIRDVKKLLSGWVRATKTKKE
ncbi:MAG: four helix bundle protein [Clostridia bacterium]|nr:four helix bundle protein [Clostridia bacterium]